MLQEEGQGGVIKEKSTKDLEMHRYSKMLDWYSARRLMGSRLIESAAYCNQIWLAQLYINSAQNTSVNWIIRLLLSLLCRPKVIPLSGGHCNTKNFLFEVEGSLYDPWAKFTLCFVKAFELKFFTGNSNERHNVSFGP